MKLLKLAFIASLFTFAFACSDDDNNGGNGIKGKGDNKDGEVQIEKAVDVLKKETDLSTFTQALEKVDGSTLAGKEFTILAYKNQKEVKSTKADDANVLRHMIEGKYTEAELLDKKKLQAVSKDTLYFGQEDGALTVNDVKVGKSMTSGNSVIFVVDSIIPVMKPWTPEPKEKYEFVVYNINTEWKEGANEYASVAADVKIRIREAAKDSLTTIDIVQTNAEGKATFEAVAGEYFYSVEGASANTYNGYKVTGLITSQAQLDATPDYDKVLDIEKRLGGLAIVDINGDGKIDENDKVEDSPIAFTNEEEVTVYLIPEDSFKPEAPEEVFPPVTEAEMEDAYVTAYDYYVPIDTLYSTKAGREKTSVNDGKLYDFWSKSYAAIELMNRLVIQTDKDDAMSEQNKNIIKARTLSKRASVYLMLATAFDKVPLQLSAKIDSTITQSTQAEVYKQVIADYDYSLAHVESNDKPSRLLNKAATHRAAKEYDTAAALLEQAINIKPDSLISEENQLYEAIYLYAAEAQVKKGDKAKAILYINKALGKDSGLIASTSNDEIMAVVKQSLKGVDGGYRMLNAKEWDNMSDWGKYAVLPIPQKAISDKKTGELAQNPGW